MTPEQIDFLRSLPNQPPDLLVYTPKLDRYWFVEVKGPTDHVRRVQANTNKEIAATLGVRVEVLNVRRAPGRLTSD